MANRLVGGILSSKQPQSSGFVSRASTGTYFNQTGTLVIAPINQPRLNYSLIGSAWTQPTVLLEPAATNLITNSQTIGSTGWSTNASTTTANNTTAPDGTTTASLLAFNASGSAGRVGGQQTIGTSVAVGQWMTKSCFFKYSTQQFIQFPFIAGTSAYYANFDIQNGSVTATGGGVQANIINCGNGWYRCIASFQYIAGQAGTDYFWIWGISSGTATGAPTTTAGGNLYAWGAQAELNTGGFIGATSYIPTVGSTVTRAQDNVGPLGSGIYTLAQIENQTAIDGQATVQTFTSTGSSYWTCPEDVTSVEVLVVAGGGGGGWGGGGAGGLIYNNQYPVVPGTTYPIVIGAGGAGTIASTAGGYASNGQNSSFSNLVAIGGGAATSYPNNSSTRNGVSGGSGGGGGRNGGNGLGGAGTYGQGNAGGQGAEAASYYGSGGGGGAGSKGVDGTGSAGGNGGAGLAFSISGSAVTYASGGGGAALSGGTQGTAPTGGGGNASATGGSTGTQNTGGGGGGTSSTADSYYGGAGGSGIVIIKYNRTNRQLVATSNAAIVTQKFSTTNLWTVPAGVTQVEALVVAGGGGGGYGTTGRSGGGGAGGVVYNSALSVTPGSTYTIGVGTGGAGSPNNSRLASVSNGFGSGIGTGTELITNGSAFTVTTGWTATTATLSVPQTGIFRILPNASVNGSASQTITTVIGTTYIVVVNVTSDTAKQFRLFAGSSQFGQQNATFFTAYTQDSLDNGATGTGFYSTTFTATATTTWIDLQIGGGTQQPTDISYISVRQATLPTFGGGGGGNASTDTSANVAGANGGSGGGGGSTATTTGTFNGGTATQSVGFGNAGGAGVHQYGAWAGGGSGGGAGSAGQIALNISGYAPPGGSGIPFSIVGTPEYYAGGGGGTFYTGTVYGPGGIGGGGTGNSTGVGANGASNTGGGGGAGGNGAGGNGGSGVVVLRYRVPTVATFLDSGAWTCPAGVTSVQALIVAGGGGGGSDLGGGGGGCGVIYDNSMPVTPGQTYPVVVGRGGIVGNPGTNGQNSSFANLIAIGGGGGGSGNSVHPGQPGGSGGGARCNRTSHPGGTGVYAQGNAGGGALDLASGSGLGCSGGGGGAGSAGANGSQNNAGSAGSGNGGNGLAYSISGSSVTYGGGGGGAAVQGTAYTPQGGTGGGANGIQSNGVPGNNATPNTGGGGGGASNGGNAGALGGSGIVIIRHYGG